MFASDHLLNTHLQRSQSQPSTTVEAFLGPQSAETRSIFMLLRPIFG